MENAKHRQSKNEYLNKFTNPEFRALLVSNGEHELKKYTNIKELGKGSYGTVNLFQESGTSNYYAAKIINLDDMKVLFESQDQIDIDKTLHFLETESINLHSISHPNIIQFKEVFLTSNTLYLITEYCNGGDLGAALEEYKLKNEGKPFSENIVQYFSRQIISAMDYLHNKKQIIHRDIKLENIFLDFPTEEDKNNFNLLSCKIKIGDFGISKHVEINHNSKVNKKNIREKLAQTIVGSSFNMAPNILKESIERTKSGIADNNFTYDFKVDIYSLGTIIYEMLFGVKPFDFTDYECQVIEEEEEFLVGIEILYNKQKKGMYNLPENIDQFTISEIGVDFILKLLKFEENKRLNISQIQNELFIKLDYDKFEEYKNNRKKELKERAKKRENNQGLKAEISYKRGDYEIKGYSIDGDNNKICTVTTPNSISNIKYNDSLSFGHMPEIVNSLREEFIFYSSDGYKEKSFIGLYIKKNIVITNEALYIFKGCKINNTFLFNDIIAISIANNANEFIINLSIYFDDECYKFESKKSFKTLFEILCGCYKAKMNNELKILYGNKEHLKKFKKENKDDKYDYIDVYCKNDKNETLLNNSNKVNDTLDNNFCVSYDEFMNMYE